MVRFSVRSFARTILLLSVLVAGLLLSTPAMAQDMTTARVSVGQGGVQGNGYSNAPRISADGRFVLFASGADNLVPGDTNGRQDLFVRDLLNSTIERVSLATDGTEDPMGGGVPAAISGDGDVIVYRRIWPASETWMYRRSTGESAIISVAWDGGVSNGASGGGDISADGRYATFNSAASNLVPDDVNGVDDIFVRDLQLGVTELASVSTSGLQAGAPCTDFAISDGGRFVVFVTRSANLDWTDTNGKDDIYLRDRLLETTRRASLASDGAQADRDCSDPHVSDDGRFVVFHSYATNLVPGDTNNSSDVFLRDMVTGTTVCLSRDRNGGPANGDSWVEDITPDGRYVMFSSMANDLIGGDTNNAIDVFVRDLATGELTPVSLGAGGIADGNSSGGGLNADGSRMVFSSAATNLVPGDTNDQYDVFLRYREPVASVPVGPSATLMVGRPFPNPMNPATRVTVTLTEPGFLQAGVHDLRGRKIRSLLAGYLEAGQHTLAWDGRDQTGRPVPAGIYLVRVEKGGQVASRRVSLVK